MRLRLIAGAAAFAVATAVSAMPGESLADPSNASPAGAWLTPDGKGVIQIRSCAEGFCGRIVGMSKLIGDDGKPPSDPHGQPNCGRDILHLRLETKPGVWAGDILDPDDDSDWRCETWIENGRLHLRGYVVAPVFGKTQDWTPYRGQVAADCRMSS